MRASRRYVRPVRVIECPRCRGRRETRQHGGLPIVCLDCGEPFECPRAGERGDVTALVEAA